MAKKPQSMTDKLEAFKQKGISEALEYQAKEKTNGLDPSIEDIANVFNKAKENEVVIKDRVYTINKFGVMETLAMIPVLGKSVIVPASHAFKDMIGEEKSLEGLPAALYDIFENMETGRFTLLLEILLDKTTLKGKPVSISEDFEDLGEVLNVCIKVLQLNFAPFLGSLGLAGMDHWLQKISTLPQ
jgi:hypothetical protein